jgi:Tfp pilus assembly protein PilP
MTMQFKWTEPGQWWWVARLVGVAGVVVATGVLSPIGAFAVSSAQEDSAAPVEVPSYDPAGRRDPFRPYVQSFERPTITGEVTPLQQYDLSQLRLVAVVTDEKNPAGTRAVVEDNSGLGFIVRVGTPIGQTRGRVASIERDRILVESWPTNVFGEQSRTVTVKELDAGEEAKR